jgi:hypothetical protein
MTFKYRDIQFFKDKRACPCPILLKRDQSAGKYSVIAPVRDVYHLSYLANQHQKPLSHHSKKLLQSHQTSFAEICHCLLVHSRAQLS